MDPLTEEELAALETRPREHAPECNMQAPPWEVPGGSEAAGQEAAAGLRAGSIRVLGMARCTSQCRGGAGARFTLESSTTPPPQQPVPNPPTATTGGP